MVIEGKSGLGQSKEYQELVSRQLVDGKAALAREKQDFGSPFKNVNKIP